MRWLLICLFVSVGALLLAAAGVVRHIWLQRAKLSGDRSLGLGASLDGADEPDIELES
jgi:hypothetical protein